MSQLYMHEELLLAAFPIYKKYIKDGLEVSELIAELNHLAWILSSFNAKGVAMLHAELKQKARGQ